MSEPEREDGLKASIDEQRGAREAERLETPRYAMPEGVTRQLVAVIAICFAAFQLYTAAFGLYEQYIQRSVHLAFGLALVALTFRFRGRGGRLSRAPGILDWLYFGACLFASLWVVYDYDRLMERIFFVDPLSYGDYAAGILLILVVLEACRRTVSWELSLLSLAFLAYGYWGQFMSGDFQAPPSTFTNLLENVYLSGDGILGVPLGVSASYVFLFILFGAFIMRIGLMQFLSDVSLAIAGGTTGGPAKVAVLCSAFFGTLSGSGIANAITTGSFTIPLMKRVGYPGHFAAGVEATSSMGGNIMPPVMGAAAFVMADLLGIDYLQVVVAAIIPAALYFFGVGTMVHFEALRRGLERLPRNQLPRLWPTFLHGWYLLLPVAVLMYFLTTGWSVTFSGLMATLSTIPVSWVRKESRITPRRLYEILEFGAITALPVIAAVAVVGIIIGVIAHTGLAVKLAFAIVNFSQGSLFVTLILAMIASLVLGLGLPTTPTYIIVAALTAPALIQYGLDPITAHFFVFYYGILADITPPTAIASYALAGIANANPKRTMMAACMIALAGYIVPFVFAFEPAMLDPFLRKEGASFVALLSSVFSAAVGIGMLSMALIGWMRMAMSKAERLALGAGALFLCAPEITSDLIGVGTLAAVFVVQSVRKARLPAGAAAAARSDPDDR
ncbi:MAG: TRAP transporter permease [Burkholderiales bacterium]|nr:MAG: TRAP transporter permease [Burkholderiales bacterium]